MLQAVRCEKFFSFDCLTTICNYALTSVPLLRVLSGNDIINALTMDNGTQYKLRIDMALLTGTTSYAEYKNFKMANSSQLYMLTSVGTYTGTAGYPTTNMLQA